MIASEKSFAFTKRTPNTVYASICIQSSTIRIQYLVWGFVFPGLGLPTGFLLAILTICEGTPLPRFPRPFLRTVLRPLKTTRNWNFYLTFSKLSFRVILADVPLGVLSLG